MKDTYVETGRHFGGEDIIETEIDFEGELPIPKLASQLVADDIVIN